MTKATKRRHRHVRSAFADATSAPDVYDEAAATSVCLDHEARPSERASADPLYLFMLSTDATAAMLREVERLQLTPDEVLSLAVVRFEKRRDRMAA